MVTSFLPPAEFFNNRRPQTPDFQSAVPPPNPGLDIAFTGMVSESSCAKHPTVLDLCVLDGLVLEVLQVCHGMGPHGVLWSNDPSRLTAPAMGTTGMQFPCHHFSGQDTEGLQTLYHKRSPRRWASRGRHGLASRSMPPP